MEARMLSTILHRLFKPTPRVRPVPQDEPAAPEDIDAERPLGCGWFDSSHELQCGLVVTEHASVDAVASELPLSDWLGLHFGGRAGAADVALALA
jgi:hypothetical protein